MTTTTQVGYGGIPGYYRPGEDEDVPTPPMTSTIGAAQPYAVAAPKLQDDGPWLVFGLLPPLVAGGIICALVLAEGMFVYVDTAAKWGSTGFLAGVSRDTAFHRVQWDLVDALAIGDMVAGLLGVLGLCLAAGVVMPIRVAGFRAAVTTFSVGALLAWRALVGIAVIPWVGFLLAFEPPEYVRWPRLLGAVVYMAVDLYLIALLVWVVRAASYRSRLLQEEFLLRFTEDSNQHLLSGAGRPAAAPEADTVLYFFPLEPAVACYSLFVAVGALLLLWNLVRTSSTGAGWALLLATGSAGASATFWMELCMYALSVPFALLAVAAIAARRQLDFDSEEPEHRAISKRCAALVLIFFVVSAFRFSLCVPVTGMALAAQDTCGLYRRGLLATSIDGPPLAIHCTATEAGILLAALAVLALDAALLVGTVRLWQRYRLGVDPAAGATKPSSPLFGKPYYTYDAGVAAPTNNAPYAAAAAGVPAY